MHLKMLSESGKAMYKLNPIISFEDNSISLPSCMYKVSNIHGRSESLGLASINSDFESDSLIIQQVVRLLQKPAELNIMIEERQKKLLEQLENLRLQMLAMKQSMHSTICVEQSVNPDLPKDIVINCDPRYPPYYLLCLQKTLHLKISCHTHSSVVNLPAPALEFAKRISNKSNSHENLNIILIWKDVGVGTKLVATSTMPVVITGDVNVMRYLVSAVPGSLHYQHSENSWEVDSILDICHQIQWIKTIKERQTLLSTLNAKLGKNKWLNDNSSYCVSDIAAWHIIKQSNINKDLNDNLKPWFQKCQSIF